MPVEKIMTLASAIVVGVVLTHPYTWGTELHKLEHSMVKNISNTRSWGNPSIFPATKRNLKLIENRHPESTPSMEVKAQGY